MVITHKNDSFYSNARYIYYLIHPKLQNVWFFFCHQIWPLVLLKNLCKILLLLSWLGLLIKVLQKWFKFYYICIFLKKIRWVVKFKIKNQTFYNLRWGIFKKIKGRERKKKAQRICHATRWRTIPIINQICQALPVCHRWPPVCTSCDYEYNPCHYRVTTKRHSAVSACSLIKRRTLATLRGTGLQYIYSNSNPMTDADQGEPVKCNA
jgi:hypothetical protein